MEIRRTAILLAALGVMPMIAQTVPSPCPIEFQKVDPHSLPFTAGLLSSDKDPWDHYLRIEYKNASAKTIIAIRFGVAFVDAMAEANQSVYSYDSPEIVKPDKVAKPYWGDGVYFHQYGYRMSAIAWLEKVRFADNTYFVDDGSHSCKFPKPPAAALPTPEQIRTMATANSLAAYGSPAAVADHVSSPQEISDAIQKGEASKCVVSTIPFGAEVEIDGNREGVSPLIFALVRKGDTPRTVTIKMSGYKTVEKRLVPDGKPITIALDLEALKGEGVFPKPAPQTLQQVETANPMLTNVAANSKAATDSPAALASAAVEGHVLSQQELVDRIQKGQASKCAIVTVPPGAEVDVDGNKSGVTPLVFVLLKRGDTPRTVTIKMSGYKTIETKVLPDGTNNCVFGPTLEKLLDVSAPPNTGSVYDFRQTNWGMSKEQVIASEGKPVSDGPDRLLYQTEVAGLKAGMEFEFLNGKLASAGYVLMEKYVEPNQYIISSNRWLEGLRAKYGEPKANIQWLNDLYRNDQTKYGLAISAGHMLIHNSWETERTNIEHIISGQNFEISVGITYTSKELQAELEKKAKEAQKTIF